MPSKEDKKYECIICKGPVYKERFHYIACKKCRAEAEEIEKTMTVDEAWRLLGKLGKQSKESGRS